MAMVKFKSMFFVAITLFGVCNLLSNQYDTSHAAITVTRGVYMCVCHHAKGEQDNQPSPAGTTVHLLRACRLFLFL